MRKADFFVRFGLPVIEDLFDAGLGPRIRAETIGSGKRSGFR